MQAMLFSLSNPGLSMFQYLMIFWWPRIPEYPTVGSLLPSLWFPLFCSDESGDFIDFHHFWPFWLIIWWFPIIGVPQNGWSIMDTPIKLDDLGVPRFKEPPIFKSWLSHSAPRHCHRKPWRKRGDAVKFSQAASIPLTFEFSFILPAPIKACSLR